jgi:imidazoleglycerol phosphate dehydratase HisB
MTQHLIRTLTDSTGHTFTHVTQARENETFTVVEAESKEEAKRLYRAVQMRNALSIVSKGTSNLRKAMQRKDNK